MLVNPSKHGSEDEYLPRLEYDALTGKRPLDVTKILTQGAHSVRLLSVKDVGTLRPLPTSKIVNLSLTSELDELACNLLPRNHPSAVCERSTTVVFHDGPLAKDVV